MDRLTMRRAIAILAGFGVLLYLGSALAGTSGEPPVPAPENLPAETAQPADTGASGLSSGPLSAVADTSSPTVTLSLSAKDVPYGKRLEARGWFSPAASGKTIAIEIAAGGGWATIAQTATEADGSYAASFDAVAAGSIRATAVESGVSTAPVELRVSPIVRLRASRGTAFGKSRLEATVSPSSYAARVTVVVRQDGRTVGRAQRRVRNGHGTLLVPTPGVGAFWVEARFPAASGLSQRAVGAKVVALGRRLAYGSTGRDVVALRARLAALAFHVPAPSTTFGSELVDSVIAFQKANGLDRTGVVDLATWRALGRAKLLKPRYRGPAHHIEVDKTRQILLEVRGGKVVAILPVSSGATGNTPEGRHQIRWKALATTTWLGPAILYRTLTFYGNSFAIHGFPSVPAYPASHGCVRIPIWTADWLYQRSPVGETVYVYR
jgi:hypothetical protein